MVASVYTQPSYYETYCNIILKAQEMYGRCMYTCTVKYVEIYGLCKVGSVILQIVSVYINGHAYIVCMTRKYSVWWLYIYILLYRLVCVQWINSAFNVRWYVRLVQLMYGQLLLVLSQGKYFTFVFALYRVFIKYCCFFPWNVIFLKSVGSSDDGVALWHRGMPQKSWGGNL